MRQIVAIIIGLIVGGVFIAGGESVLHSLSGVNVPSENATQKELFDYVQQIPVLLKVLLVVNWGMSVFIAGLVASFIQGRTSMKPSIIVAGILQLFMYMNMLLIPGHPTWVLVTTTIMCVPLGIISYLLIRKKGKETTAVDDLKKD
jgi:type III secretory pathway component EscV